MVQTRALTKWIESGEGSNPKPSPTKKRRTGNAEEHLKQRHKGKSTAEFCQLNLDILFLLVSYIHPLDLLNLARTCKSLWQLLMDKSSAFIWKAARQQVEGLPPCPGDLTEQEYANLAFYARCHGCGKHAKKIFWSLRRRYCAVCRPKRLCSIDLCPDFMSSNTLPSETLMIGDESGMWVDKEQKDSFVREYNDAPNKAQFMEEKRSQCHDIRIHASDCKDWQKREASHRRSELDIRRRERCDSILERLQEHGFAPEIAYFGSYEIEESHAIFFSTSKPLTDKAWAEMWPESLEIMNDFRSRRLEATVYRPRRMLLKSKYDKYLKSTPSSTTAIEFLPALQDLRSFTGFEEVINAPEGAKLGAKPFESAFTLLPALIEQWRVQLNDELASLVVTPPHFPGNPTPGDGVSSSETLGSSQACIDKLHLAYAVFERGNNLASYPDILFLPDQVCSTVRQGNMGNMGGTVSTRARLGIEFVEEAFHVVYACGLDPNAARPEDMDRRNARLECLICDNSIVMDWKDALWHAHFWCRGRQLKSSPSLPWFQLVSDEHIEAIQAIEGYSPNDSVRSMRCLLCPPRVGNGLDHYQLKDHFVHIHNIKGEAIQRLYSSPISILCERWQSHVTIKMVEKGGRVTFRVGSIV